MSSRGLGNKLGRMSARSWLMMALVSTLLIAAGATGLRHVAASRSAARVAGTKAATSAITSLSSGRSAGSSRVGSTGAGSIVGVVEGKFDARTRQITLNPTGQKNLKVTYKSYGRVDANTPIAAGTYTTTFNRSCANPSGTVPCSSTAPSNTISGELTIANTGAVTLYNTRLVFTDFLDVKGGIPVTANAYYNDGQVPANGKLGVSRDYGDIANGSSQARVWSFFFPSGSLTSFYFRYVIYADMGVATESVEPAAVQNNANATITINGQNFTSPTVQLLDSSNAVAATLATSNVTATSMNATVPSGTAAGIYSIRVVNAGGTAGGSGSSTLVGRLTVTAPPDINHTGVFSSFNDSGPFLVNANSTISGTILPGTVIYVADGVNLAIGTGLTANGGIPGVTATSPQQIVFTRAPGATSWGGLNATASTGDVTLKNVVVEYGGTGSAGQVDITGSGRTLTFTDSISRRGGGRGLKASGASDKFTGFTRSRVENNTGAAVYLSANAALGTGSGMADLNSANANTRVPDQSYYYSAADVVRNNGTDAIQIDATNNDFTVSGPLVGMGSTPIQILGDNTNPSIIGTTGSSTDLALNPGLLLQLAAGLDIKVGDGSGLQGSLAANGWSGVSQSPGANTSISQPITIDKVSTGGNFGSVYFSSTSSSSSILNFVTIQNGGTSTLGQGQVIVDAITYPLTLTNTNFNSSSSYGIQYRGDVTVDLTGGNYNSNSTGTALIIPILSTIAGGTYGDGNQANKASLYRPVVMAVDPNRGIYFIDYINSLPMLRFVNTTNATQIIAGVSVPAKGLKNLSSGQYFGNDSPSDSPVDTVDFFDSTSMALSPDGNVLYWTQLGAATTKIFALNVTPGSSKGANTSKVIAGVNTKVGNITPVFNDTGALLSSTLKGMAVNPVSGDIYLCDAGNSKLVKITTAGVLSNFAGTGTRPGGLFAWQAFPAPASGSSSTATGFYLYDPEAVAVSSDGNTVYVSDGRFCRVVRIQSGTARLVTQLGNFDASAKFDTSTNPFPIGLTVFNSSLYIANGNAQTIVRIDNPSSVSASAGPPSGGALNVNNPVVNLVSGVDSTPCDYTSTACGDGGSGTVGYSMQNVYENLIADASGLIIVDQAYNSRGRIRYLNLSGATVTRAGISIGNNVVNTIGGNGLALPFNGALATSAVFESTPAGIALDSSSNVWVTESNIGNGGSPLKFINRSNTTINILGQSVVAGGMVRINYNATDPSTEESTDPSTAYFYSLEGLAATGEGIYIVDSNGKSVPATLGRKTSKLRFLNTSASTVVFYSGSGTPISVPSGQIKTIAGGSTDPSSFGDNGFATSAKLFGTSDVAIHPSTGDIYLAESANLRIRKIDRSTGIITSLSSPTGNAYSGVAFDSSGRLYVAVYDTDTVLRQNVSGGSTFSAISSSITLKGPRDIVVDSSNNVYVMSGYYDANITSNSRSRIIKVASGGTATVFVGTDGTPGIGGDGGSPTSATAKMDLGIDVVDVNVSPSTTENLVQNCGIALSATGELIFADSRNYRVRRVK